MKKSILLICVLAGLIINGYGQILHSEEELKLEAIAAADAWLVLVDSAEYGQSWEQAASFFRNAISKEKWEESLSRILPAYGKIISRDFVTATYKTSLPGAPDGEYVVITYKTKFERKAKSIETITPMREEDGSWHVSGYFIK